MLLQFFGKIVIVFLQHNLQNFEGRHFQNTVEWLILFYHQKPKYKFMFHIYGTFTLLIQLRYLIVYMRYGPITIGPRICSIEIILAILSRRKISMIFLSYCTNCNFESKINPMLAPIVRTVWFLPFDPRNSLE